MKKLFIFAFVFLPLNLLASSSNISGISFVTPSQTIGVGELSPVLTIQAQNSSSICEKVDEKTDLEFTSTSLTGVFQSSSGGSLQKYFTSGTCNRNFTYQDSSSGSFTLTVKAVNYPWQASQSITVGSGTSSRATSTGLVLGTSTAAVASVGSGASFTAQKIGKVKINITSRVPIHTQSYFWSELENSESSPDIIWSFGDGAVAYGGAAYHAFDNVGTYVVTARAPSLGPQAVTRVRVEVYAPRLLLGGSQAGPGGYIELLNPDANDLDISNYTITSGRYEFRLPEGTFVAGNGAARISNNISRMTNFADRLDLYAPDGAYIDELSLSGTIGG